MTKESVYLKLKDLKENILNKVILYIIQVEWTKLKFKLTFAYLIVTLHCK